MKAVNRSVRKKDAMQLLTGQPVYTDDLAPKDCLVVKLLRSPHANAWVEQIDTAAALRVPGVEAVFTWQDVPQEGPRYTQAGQTYPEPSPHDRLVIDRHVRFVGDVVAIVAARDEQAADKALKCIKVQYQVLEPVLDFRTAKDNPILVHPEENWESLCPVGADNKRNLCAHDQCGSGDIEAVLADCDLVIDRTYHTKACQQAMMETFRTFCTLDPYGRLNVVSSTQIVFHARRIIAAALHIPKSMVRVSKPRIGGGFGAKQTAVCEVYPAFVTWKTKKPSKLVFTRVESQTASSPRHEMELHVRLGAMKDGTIRGIDLYTLSNTGAYGEHGPTTVGLSGHKSIPLYGKAEAFRFTSDVVYTNHMSSGAYRGYGATQGLFAVESAVNELAAALGMDPFDLRTKNITHEGERMPAYYGELNTSCTLDQCLTRVREMIHWDEKYPVRPAGPHKVRAVGMAMSMQGSGISGVDVGSATLKLNDDGFYTLLIGAADTVELGPNRGSWGRPIWAPAAIPPWPRSQPRCWIVRWRISPSAVQIRTSLRMIPAPMRPAPYTSPAKRWKSALSSCGNGSAGWVRSCWAARSRRQSSTDAQSRQGAMCPAASAWPKSFPHRCAGMISHWKSPRAIPLRDRRLRIW